MTSKKNGKKEPITEIDLSGLEDAGFQVSTETNTDRKPREPTAIKIAPPLQELVLSGEYVYVLNRKGEAIGIKKKAERAVREPREPRERKEPRYGFFPPASTYTDGRISELEALIESFPVAESFSLQIPDQPGIDTANFKGTVVDGLLIDAPSKDYNVIQHREAFEPLVSFLKSRPEFENMALSASHNKKRVSVHAIFLDDKFKVTGPDGRDVHLGLQIQNSFDRTTGLNITGAGYRRWCTNGVVLRSILGERRISHVTDPRKAVESAGLAVDTIMSAIETVKSAMALAGKTKITAAEFADVVEFFDGQKRHQAIMNEVFSQQKTEDMYSAWIAATDAAVTYPSEAVRVQALSRWEDFISEPEAVRENIPEIQKQLIEIRAKA